MIMRSGLFLTLEGIEGVGKSTCLKFINKYLSEYKIPHIVTREPGGTPLAEEIRQVILHYDQNENNEKISPVTELLLLFASRAQHLAHVILPALQAGQWVICDRFTDASYAYQGGERGIAENKIALLEQWVQDDFRPNLTLLLDAPVRKALSRTKTRVQKDRIEQEKEYFFREVRKVYLARAQRFPDKYCIINAARPFSKVKEDLKKILEQLMEKFHKDGY